MPIVVVKILLHMSWSSKNINKMTNYKAVKFWSRIYVFSMFPGLGHNFVNAHIIHAIFGTLSKF